jgi:hypothetical protein
MAQVAGNKKAPLNEGQPISAKKSAMSPTHL